MDTKQQRQDVPGQRKDKPHQPGTPNRDRQPHPSESTETPSGAQTTPGSAEGERDPDEQSR
jgi:hypothetical protein